MSSSELRSVRAQIADAKQALEDLRAERDALKAERLRLQEKIGLQHGKRVMPRSKVEKTNGVPSLVVGQRMMQRVHRRAPNPTRGIDDSGAVFANPERTADFARSHGVPVPSTKATEAARQVIVHAFKGDVGLVEVRSAGLVRHFDGERNDPGDIRPGAEYGPEIDAPTAFTDLCTWSGRLSRYIPRPYVQVCWREDADGVTLDRIDVDPDRIPVLIPEWDRRLGMYFDSAHARVLMQPYRVGALDNRVPGGTFSYEEES
jgi:hypothetical protein